MEGAIVVIVVAGVYVGWLWNNRGANEYRLGLAAINFLERVKRRKTGERTFRQAVQKSASRTMR